MGTRSCDLLRTFTEQASAGEAKTEPQYCAQQAGSHQTALLPPVQPPHSRPLVQRGKKLSQVLFACFLFTYLSFGFIAFITLHLVHYIASIRTQGMDSALCSFRRTSSFWSNSCVFSVHMIGRGKLPVFFAVSRVCLQAPYVLEKIPWFHILYFHYLASIHSLPANSSFLLWIPMCPQCLWNNG